MQSIDYKNSSGIFSFLFPLLTFCFIFIFISSSYCTL